MARLVQWDCHRSSKARSRRFSFAAHAGDRVVSNSADELNHGGTKAQRKTIVKSWAEEWTSPHRCHVRFIHFLNFRSLCLRVLVVQLLFLLIESTSFCTYSSGNGRSFVSGRKGSTARPRSSTRLTQLPAVRKPSRLPPSWRVIWPTVNGAVAAMSRPTL
jgi:hypothetical protein